MRRPRLVHLEQVPDHLYIAHAQSTPFSDRERILHWQPTGPNPLDDRNDSSRPALRHGNVDSLFQVALHLPSYARRVRVGVPLRVPGLKAKARIWP